MFLRSPFVLAVAAMLLECAGGLKTGVAAPAADPFLWLEAVHGARAMAWVRHENAKTVAVLGGDRRYAAFAAGALHVREAQDRIALPSLVSRGEVYEFRRDAAHVRGIWRTTALADLGRPSAVWTTILDLDALAVAEHKNWVWQDADCDSTSETRCLVSLSEGGEDAATIREFDLTKRAFVPGGFTLPRGKSRCAWVDDDTLLVAREWTPGEVTTSGYPYVVKRLRRGQPLGAAEPVYAGVPSDVSDGPETMQDAAGRRLAFVYRGETTFEHDLKLVTPAGLIDVPFPRKSGIVGIAGGRLVLDVNEAWRQGGALVPAGSVVSMDVDGFLADPRHPKPVAVYVPGPRDSYQEATATRDTLFLATLDNVRGRVFAYRPAANGTWTSAALALPDNASIGAVAADDRGDDALFTVTSFLTPTTLWHYDAASGALGIAESSKARFDATRDVVQQHEAVSKDGTRVPYFIVHPRDTNDDGSNPTLLEAYGGFQVSETPSYRGVLGKLWLARGGTYVLANIRGGGEFGPAWHEAGLKTHRQRIYDDFAAVARDLIARKVTTPRRLGIVGGSNGGLLMGVEFTQHPELWHAVDIQIPLLDMLRYEKIEAGSSWTGEYGRVAVPAERAFLAKISPYQNLHAGVRYPKPFVWTTTKDDRVGPEHARKFAAALGALHDPYYFFEQTEGGHGSGANSAQAAKLDAMEYVYFAQQLVD